VTHIITSLYPIIPQSLWLAIWNWPLECLCHMAWFIKISPWGRIFLRCLRADMDLTVNKFKQIGLNGFLIMNATIASQFYVNVMQQLAATTISSSMIVWWIRWISLHRTVLQVHTPCSYTLHTHIGLHTVNIHQHINVHQFCDLWHLLLRYAPAKTKSSV